MEIIDKNKQKQFILSQNLRKVCIQFPWPAVKKSTSLVLFVLLSFLLISTSCDNAKRVGQAEQEKDNAQIIETKTEKVKDEKLKNQNIPFKIGHFPIKINNLHNGFEDFEKLGFTLSMGSEQSKAFNAMIYFEDTSFLEILCTDKGIFGNILGEGFLKIMGLFKNKKNMAKAFSLLMDLPEGFTTYALDSVPGGSYETNILKMRENGLNVSPPIKVNRTRSDGIKLTWYLAFADDSYLPFFMSDYKPNIPVPKDKLIHKNGVIGFKEMFISTSKWYLSLESYKAIFGQDPEIESKNGCKMCTFKVNTAFVHLVESDFDGVDEIVLLGSENSTEGYLDSTLTHGAKIRIEKN